MVKISLMLDMGPPQARNPHDTGIPQRKGEDSCSVEDKVRHALELIDSGYDSHVEWLMINRLYKDLCALKKPSERALNILQMIEPVMSKYGQFGVAQKDA